MSDAMPVKPMRAMVLFAPDPTLKEMVRVMCYWQPGGLLPGHWWMGIQGFDRGRFWTASRETLLEFLCATVNLTIKERTDLEQNMVAIEQQEGV